MFSGIFDTRSYQNFHFLFLFAADNMLYLKDGTMKLADFGLATGGVLDNATALDCCGTVNYMARKSIIVGSISPC